MCGQESVPRVAPDAVRRLREQQRRVCTERKHTSRHGFGDALNQYVTHDANRADSDVNRESPFAIVAPRRRQKRRCSSARSVSINVRPSRSIARHSGLTASHRGGRDHEDEPLLLVSVQCAPVMTKG